MDPDDLARRTAALSAGQRLYFEEVTDPSKADKGSAFHALDTPQSP